MLRNIAFILLLQVLAVLGSSIIELSSYNISDVTVSGVSAGGYMAVQMHVAYSNTVNGAAVFAGGPYYCAESTVNYAEYKCMATYMGLPNAVKLESQTWEYASANKIDTPLNLKDDRVFIFSGTSDSVVSPDVVKVLQQYYQAFVDVSNIVADYSVKAEHCQPTLNLGNACSMLASPYIGKCSYDGAGIAFQSLFGQLNDRVTQVKANLFQFNQKPFISSTNSAIDDSGYIYIPTACQDGVTSCRLHISYHGCKQDLKSVGNIYASEAGYNEWAESNNIIVVYPYVTSTKMPSNPNACWDWWAYTGTDYGLKSGKQMQFSKAIIDKLSGANRA